MVTMGLASAFTSVVTNCYTGVFLKNKGLLVLKIELKVLIFLMARLDNQCIRN